MSTKFKVFVTRKDFDSFNILDKMTKNEAYDVDIYDGKLDNCPKDEFLRRIKARLQCLNLWHGNGHEPIFLRVAKSW